MPVRPPSGVPFLPPQAVADRSFAQNVDRLVKRTTIVNSADDIRRAITLCLVEQRPCTLELGSNIACTSGFTIPGGLKAFSIDGAQRFKLIVNGDLPFLFYAQGAENNDGCPVEVRNVEILVKHGAALTTAFIVEQASSIITLQKLSLSLDNVIVDGTSGVITNVFSIGSTTLARVVADRLSMFGVTNIFAGGSNLTAWTWSRFTDVIVTGAGLLNATLGRGASSPAFIECVFMRIAGSFDVDVGDQSNNNFWSVVQGNGGIFRTNGAAGFRQTVLRVGNFGTRALSVGDVDLDNINTTADITLNSAGPTLTPGAANYVRVTHGAGASGNVTVSGTGAVDGRPVILRFVSVAGTAIYADNIGNLRLTANFTPTADDTLTIVYDSTTGLWYEVSRSVN